MMGRRTAVLAVALSVALGLAAGACGGDAGPRLAELQSGRTLLAGDYPRYLDEESGITVILGTPDLGPGRQRVGFVLSDDQDIVRLPVVSVETYHYPRGEQGEAEGPVQAAQARFFEFPFGVRGMHAVELDFDRIGTWAIAVSLPRPDGEVATARFAFTVFQETLAPPVGAPAPAIDTPTLADVADVRELTTSSEPDRALYERSVTDALAAGRPFVIVFASPAFCTNALCGPQVEVLSELRARHGAQADFIHVDLYENPHEIQGDLARAVRRPLLKQWGIETDEWTFVVDGSGRIAARFEAFVTEDELEAALLRAIEGRTARPPGR